MRNQSSSSVSVIWLDRKAVVASIKRSVSRLARSHPEIERVLMFGSMARNEAVPGSDVDLLFIVSKSERRFVDRLPEYMMTNRYVPVDVLVYTRDEIEKMTRDGNPLIRQAVKEGITVFERVPDSTG